jgi:serine phosphatase RsbU (regulator of sigma subunit)
MMSHGDLRELLSRAPAQDGVPWIMERLREINPGSVFDDDVSLVELSFP